MPGVGLAELHLGQHALHALLVAGRRHLQPRLLERLARVLPARHLRPAERRASRRAQ